MVKKISSKTVADFLRWQDYLVFSPEALKSTPRPKKLRGKHVPEDLNDLTLGQLMQLQTIKDEKGLFFKAPEVILGMTPAEVLKCPTVPFFGFINFVSQELQRIVAMWEQCSTPPTPEQLEAGILTLNPGPFGVIDTWALRMGFTDHNEAEKTKWIVVWQCLKIDADKAAYERRYQAVIERKTKTRR